MSNCLITASLIVGIILVFLICSGFFQNNEPFSNSVNINPGEILKIVGKDYIEFEWYRWTDSPNFITIGKYNINYFITSPRGTNPFSDFYSLKTTSKIIDNKNIPYHQTYIDPSAGNNLGYRKYFLYKYTYSFKYYPRFSDEIHNVVITDKPSGYSEEIPYYHNQNNYKYEIVNQYKFVMPSLLNLQLTRPQQLADGPDLYKTFSEMTEGIFNLLKKTNPLRYGTVEQYDYPYVHGFHRPIRPFTFNFLRIDVSKLVNNYLLHNLKIVIDIRDKNGKQIYKTEFVPSTFPVTDITTGYSNRAITPVVGGSPITNNGMVIYTGPTVTIESSLNTAMNTYRLLDNIKNSCSSNGCINNSLVVPIPSYDFPPDGSPYTINCYLDTFYSNQLEKNVISRQFQVNPLN